MANDSQPTNRLLAAGIPRKAEDDQSPAQLMKLFKTPEVEADPLPQLKQVKLTPVRYEPPQAMRLETPRNDYTEEFLAEQAAARAKAMRAKPR